MKKKVTAASLRAAKEKGEKQAWLTAYDAGAARIAEHAGVDVILVGDSVGMVNLGYDTTIPVTLDDMILHTSAVVRGCRLPWVVCDLPFGTYQQSPAQAFASCVQVLQQTGCDALKLEGGQAIAPTIQALSAQGLAIVGHIGMTPQSVKKFGSFRQRGQTEAERQSIMLDAIALEKAGAVALVVECVPADLAAEITAQLAIPIIGIGAGKHCDAQVLVWHDLLGLSDNPPPFATAYCNLKSQAITAIQQWVNDVRHGDFPA